MDFIADPWSMFDHFDQEVERLLNLVPFLKKFKKLHFVKIRIFKNTK